MAAFADLCRFVATAGGTTDWTFSSAVGGCQSPSAAGVVNGVVYKVYAVSNDLTQWEISQGTYNSTTHVFLRTTVLYNSSGTGTAAGQSGAGTKISFSTTPQVAVIAIAEDLISVEVANAFTTVQQGQARANIGVATGAAAVKTDQQTATSAVLAVTPLHQQDHPSACKAWGFMVGGSSPSIVSAYNIASITRSAIGTYVITWVVPFSTANYAVNVTLEEGAAANTANVLAQSTSSVTIATLTFAGTSGDAQGIYIQAFGTQ